jgi:hypothetical protein
MFGVLGPQNFWFSNLWANVVFDILLIRNQMNMVLDLTPDERFKRYGYKGGESTIWKDWTIYKRAAGFGFGYLLLRELPIRNFYARSFIMAGLFAKMFDQYGIPFLPNGYGNTPHPVKVGDLFEAG